MPFIAAKCYKKYSILFVGILNLNAGKDSTAKNLKSVCASCGWLAEFQSELYML